MVEITFTSPSYLWILAIVPFLIIIHFFTLKQSRAAVIKFSNFEAIERVARGEVLGTSYRGLLKNKNLGLLFLRALVYCLLILSVAGTTIWYSGKTSDFDYVFAIDSSASMLADDFIPTRLEAAKETAGEFVNLVPSGAKIGVLTFASTSLIELRPTSDFQEVSYAIANVGPQETGGTAVGDAIVTSTNLFNSNKSKAIILITDGRSNVGVDPDVAIQYAKQNDVTIHTIGVATKEGGNVSSLRLLSTLDEDFLRRISEETNGKSFIATSVQNLTNAFREIASSTEKILSLNISWILLISAIVLLGFEWILINTTYKTIP